MDNMKIKSAAFHILIILFYSGIICLYSWESRLFPRNGNSYRSLPRGSFELPDFSWAGYHAGEDDIPAVKQVETVSASAGDSTAIIQQALQRAAGRGAVVLSSGIFFVSNELVIPARTVLRGQGPDHTRLIVNHSATKNKSVIIAGQIGSRLPLARSADFKGSRPFFIDTVKKDSDTISVYDPASLKAGDLILAASLVTDQLRAEYNISTHIENVLIWPELSSGFRFIRRITAVDKSSGVVTLDHPAGWTLKDRDNAYLVKFSSMLEEIGVEDLSIGFTTPSEHEIYHNIKNTEGEKSSFHHSRAVHFVNVINGWIKNVSTFSPDNNSFHLHSLGLVISDSKWITADNCDFGFPVHIGGRENGNIYVLEGAQNCLIRDCTARYGRHNVFFKAGAMGNVISGFKDINGMLKSESYHGLAARNLIENSMIYVQPDRVLDFIGFTFQNRRKLSDGAGFTGADNVFWKVRLLHPESTIVSEQAGADKSRGYVIGCTSVWGRTDTWGTEWREGIGSENSLRPVSLYNAQLVNRMKIKTIFH